MRYPTQLAVLLSRSIVFGSEILFFVSSEPLSVPTMTEPVLVKLNISPQQDSLAQTVASGTLTDWLEGCWAPQGMMASARIASHL